MADPEQNELDFTSSPKAGDRKKKEMPKKDPPARLPKGKAERAGKKGRACRQAGKKQKPGKPGKPEQAASPPPKGPRIVPTMIEGEMRSSYIDYAMSVIVGRALPDIRDGLKPVHRRILFAMDELGLRPGKPHKKSARIVGEVLGKYHPHGDTAVYDSMVRMAQDFSLRYMLVDGQGNFGSVDGDSPAAMRYTEARLAHAAAEMLADIEKETVNFVPNFDESLKEPSVLPSKIPNLIINGSSGIAVGMATNIPPHNLSEVVDGTVAYIDNPEISIKELNGFIKGPDFPTGGIICGHSGITDAYATGRGLLTLRAKTDEEKTRTGKEVIIIKELPYMVNKAQLVEKIANCVKEKQITGITDLRDESDREGMRVYIELKHGANKDVILNQLFKHTDMQTTFGVNLLALVGGEPKVLTLKDMIVEYVKHREEIITRRTRYDLRIAEEQAHILEGLRIALKNLDAVIALIKKSKTVDEAREGLMSRFKLTKIQAQAILDMKLQRLTGLEREKIEEEYQKLKKLIAELKDLLASKKKILGVVKKELLEIKEKYGDARRTKLAAAAEDIEEEALIPDVEVAILITRDGYIKRMLVSAFRAQLRGGKGVTGMATREEDEIDKIIVASTLNYILFFTNKGKVYKTRVYEIPEAGRAAKGQSIENLLEVGKEEHVTVAIPVKTFEKNKFLFMATREGKVKKTSLDDFENVRRTGIIAIKLKDGEELGWVRETDGKQEVILSTKGGLLIRFKEKDVRPMGRTAAGVKGITLRKGDSVVAMDIVAEKMDLLEVSKDGYGKRMEVKEFRVQRRGGKGLTAMKLRKGDEVARARLIEEDDELLFVSAKGTISRQTAAGISTQGRYAMGVRIQRLDKDDYVVDIARVVKSEEKPG
ncbi:MAG: DNA gyrase subunit A [bacterium]